MTLAEELYASLGPLTTGDEETGFQLRSFCEALCEGSGAQDLYDLLRDRDDRPGWAIVFDPDECPVLLLPYLAQFVGVTLEPGWTESERREAIRDHVGWRRGTPAAIIRAVQRVMTGSKSVRLVERVGGNAYRMDLIASPDEVPDEDAFNAAILTQKPIGIQLGPALAHQTWAEFRDSTDTWGTAEVDYEDWRDVKLPTP